MEHIGHLAVRAKERPDHTLAVSPRGSVQVSLSQRAPEPRPNAIASRQRDEVARYPFDQLLDMRTEEQALDAPGSSER